MKENFEPTLHRCVNCHHWSVRWSIVMKQKNSFLQLPTAFLGWERLCFWDGDGIIMTDYLEQGHTITGNYYSALLAKLRSTLAKKSRGKLQKGILLLHDNAPAHRSMMAVHTSMQCGFTILLHPPYSPDLAPSDFFLFPSLKKHLKGQRFHSNEDVISAGEEWFESHPKSYYAQGLLKVKEKWQKCVDMQGDYVEK